MDLKHVAVSPFLLTDLPYFLLVIFVEKGLDRAGVQSELCDDVGLIAADYAWFLVDALGESLADGAVPDGDLGAQVDPRGEVVVLAFVELADGDDAVVEVSVARQLLVYLLLPLLICEGALGEGGLAVLQEVAGVCEFLIDEGGSDEIVDVALHFYLVKRSFDFDAVARWGDVLDEQTGCIVAVFLEIDGLIEIL